MSQTSSIAEFRLSAGRQTSSRLGRDYHYLVVSKKETELTIHHPKDIKLDDTVTLQNIRIDSATITSATNDDKTILTLFRNSKLDVDGASSYVMTEKDVSHLQDVLNKKGRPRTDDQPIIRHVEVRFTIIDGESRRCEVAVSSLQFQHYATVESNRNTRT